MDSFQFWLLTTAIGVVGLLVWTIGMRIVRSVDELKREIRAFDVRLTRVETTLWPTVTKEQLARHH